MGIIIAGVRTIKQPYDYILQTANRVYTSSLQSSMTEFVADCFRTLKPLSYEFTEVCEVKGEYSSYKLCIGEWLRAKHSYQEYGSTVDYSESIFEAIREHGDELKPHVRKPIKKDFADLVDLAKQLQPYDTLSVLHEIPRTEVYEYFILREGGMSLTSFSISKIGIKTSNPWRLLLFKDGKEEQPDDRDLTDDSKASLFEDIISHIVDLFKKADAKVSVVREHNEKIMGEMARIVSPWKIANNLKNNNG